MFLGRSYSQRPEDFDKSNETAPETLIESEGKLGRLEAPMVEAVKHSAGLAAIAGSIFYASFWIGSVLSLDAAWGLTLSWHALSVLLLALGIVGLQLFQAHSPQGWLGWVGAAFILLGLVTLVELMFIGTLLFGLAVVLGGTLPRSGGVLLAVGAAAFLATTMTYGPFWSEENPQPPLIPSAVFIAALLFIAIGWVVLGWSHHKSGSV